ncbi:fibronectin type III domain-containing protein [Candidatus Woesearchaeota archaeon]|nr:fibronectin type III domain-containing protein [Candidatus Woesearchaeota archaeon]
MKYKRFISCWLISLIVLFPVAFALTINPDSISAAPTDKTSQINWTTDVLSDGKVHFGETVDKLKTIPDTSGFQLQHSVNLNSLEQGTKYFYKVESGDGTITTALETFKEFSTLLSPPKELTAKKINFNEIQITWQLNPKAAKYKIYVNVAVDADNNENTNNNDDDKTIAESSTNEYTIKELAADTEYEIQVSCIDNQNKESAYSEVLLVKTIKKPLEIKFVQVQDISKTSAIINWITTEDANSTVLYGKTNSLNLIQADSELTKNHSVILINLDENTKYNYKIKSNNLESQLQSFTTLSNESIEITNIRVSSASKNSAIIEWETNLDNAGEVVYSIDDLFSSSVKEVQQTKQHTVNLQNLLSGTMYYFKVKAAETVSSYSTFTTNDSLGSFLTLIDAPKIANSYTINISGKSKPLAKLYIFVNEQKTAQVITTLTESGEFKKEIKLNQYANYNNIQGNNFVQVMSWDKAGKKDKAEFFVLLDVVKPELQVNQFTKYTSNSNLNISGISEPNAIVELFINNASKGFALINESGFFSKVIGLSQNNQTVKVQAKDVAGNINFFEQLVTLDKKAPTITFETQFASETHFKFLTVTGQTEPFTKLYVTNYGEFTGCNDIQFTNRVGKCTTFVSNKYMLPSTVVSANLDPFGIIFGTVQEVDTEEDGTFIVRVPMFQGLQKAAGVNKIQFLAVDDAGNTHEVIKTIKYNPGCSDWVINFGEVQAYPFNIYTKELTAQSLQASAFIPIQYIGSGSPKIGNIIVTEDDISVREGLLGKTGEVISQEDGNKYVSIQSYKVSQYDPINGKAYIYIPLTFSKYNGKIDDLKDQINVYLNAKINYNVNSVSNPSNLQAPLQSQYTQAGAASCEVFPMISFSIQKPIDYSLWLTPSMINKSIEVLDKTISTTQDIVDVAKKASMYTLLACGAAVAFHYLSAAFDSSSDSNVADGSSGVPSQCRESDEGLETVYYICDRVLCPAAPPVCDDFQAQGKWKNGVTGKDLDAAEQATLTQNNKQYEDKYLQLKNDKKLPEPNDYYISKEQFIAKYKDDPKVFGDDKTIFSTGYTPLQAPNYFTTTIGADGTQGYEVEYYPIQNGRLVDKNTIHVPVGQQEITINLVNSLEQQVKRSCKPGDQTLIRYTKFNKDSPSFKAGGATTTYEDQFECSPKPVEEIGVPKAGEFVGCYNSECPQFDDTKCFGSSAAPINPPEGLWASVRCGCLPGIKGHLENLLRIMQGARKCLQQAQIGEVRGGYCERLLAQFICDIFVELVLKSLFHSSSQGGGLIGGLFGGSDVKDYKSKSTSVEERLSQRYGGILKDRFGLSSDQLINKFCIFSITLDWSLLEDVLNQVVESIEVAPIVHLEGESRAYGYDPFTGKMNIGYNVYLGIVPGGSTDVNMWLECDRNYEGGELCGTAVPRYTEIPGYRRHFEKQDIFDENLPFVVANSQWWYNKVVLEVNYRIGNKIEKKVIERAVNRKGDLAAGCMFSITEGISCQGLTFLQDQGGIIELYKESAANGGTTLTPKAATYYIGNNVNALVRLRNEFKKELFFIRVDYSDGRQSIEYPIPTNQNTYGSEQTYLLWIDTIGGTSQAIGSQGLRWPSSHQTAQAFDVQKFDSVDYKDNYLLLELGNGDAAAVEITAEVIDKNGNKFDADNFKCYVFNKAKHPDKSAIYNKYNAYKKGKMKGDSIKEDNDDSERITDDGKTICLREGDIFKFQGKEIPLDSVKNIKITQVQIVPFQMQSTIQLNTQEIPQLKLITNKNELLVPFEVQQLTLVTTAGKTVTINVLQDTNGDAKGDTPILYDNTLQNNQQQSIQLQYLTAANPVQNTKPMVEFLEPVGKFFNPEGDIPLGVSIIDDSNAVATLEFTIRGSGTNQGFNCADTFVFDKTTKEFTRNENKTGEKICNIKIDGNRKIEHSKLNFYAFKIEADEQAQMKNKKGPDDIYDITVTLTDDKGLSDSKSKQSIRFDQRKGEYELKKEHIIICLGSYDCYSWGNHETASNLISQQPNANENKVIVNAGQVN